MVHHIFLVVLSISAIICGMSEMGVRTGNGNTRVYLISGIATIVALLGYGVTAVLGL